MSFVSTFFLFIFVASGYCQVPDGCRDCGLPDHPNCEFGDCTQTCSWCEMRPEDTAAFENLRTQMRILNQMAWEGEIAEEQ